MHYMHAHDIHVQAAPDPHETSMRMRASFKAVRMCDVHAGHAEAVPAARARGLWRSVATHRVQESSTKKESTRRTPRCERALGGGSRPLMVYTAVEMRMLWTEKWGKASHLPATQPLLKKRPHAPGQTARHRPMAL